MNEEFSPEVLIEYFCWTHFVDNDGCFQRNKKKKGGGRVLTKSLLIFHHCPRLLQLSPVIDR